MAKVNRVPAPADTAPPKAQKYDYILSWIEESNEARRSQNALVERTVQAYQGDPSRNYYKKVIKEYVDSVTRSDSIKGKELQASCNDLPDKKNFTIHNGVETVVSMAMGGVGQYEFGPYDPGMKKDDRVMDRLASAAKHFYQTEKVDAIIPQYIRNAVLSGCGWLHIKQKNKKKVITVMDTSQMISDPKRFKTNCERFLGFSQRESFKAIKDRVRKAPGGGYVVKTINEADVYVSQLVNEMNSTLTEDSTNAMLHDSLRKDLDIFYKPLLDRIKANRETDPQYMYSGDEVEISYMYDLMNDLYFEIINRKYIIVAKPNDLSRDIKCTYADPETGKDKNITKTVKLNHPFVELPYMKTFWDRYPITPIFYILDDFDGLCAMESVLYHNLSIMAPITFVGQSSDAVKVARVASVSGEIVEGLPQTFGVLNKTHDLAPVMTAIQRYEERIKRIMKAVDPFELQGMLGDRATAKEVVSASGQVSQGLNPFIANIEAAMATLGDKFLKLEIIFGEKDKPYSFTHNGKYCEVTPEEMAGDYEIHAKLASSIKLEQEANARRALELIQYLGGVEAIDKKQFLGKMIPISVNGLVSREEAENMVKPDYRPMPAETIARIRKQAEEDAKRSDVDKLDLSEYTPQELDALVAQYSGGPAATPALTTPDPSLGGVDPSIMGNIDPTTGQPISSGIPPQTAPPAPVINNGIPGSVEEAGIIANDPTSLI